MKSLKEIESRDTSLWCEMRCEGDVMCRAVPTAFHVSQKNSIAKSIALYYWNVYRKSITHVALPKKLSVDIIMGV